MRGRAHVSALPRSEAGPRTPHSVLAHHLSHARAWLPLGHCGNSCLAPERTLPQPPESPPTLRRSYRRCFTPYLFPRKGHRRVSSLLGL
jgi:hypothetical protein